MTLGQYPIPESIGLQKERSFMLCVNDTRNNRKAYPCHQYERIDNMNCDIAKDIDMKLQNRVGLAALATPRQNDGSDDSMPPNLFVCRKHGNKFIHGFSSGSTMGRRPQRSSATQAQECRQYT